MPTIRLLNRLGIEVVLPAGEGCCGALVHHMGREKSALDFARANVDAWTREIEGDGLDAILITASGCGTTIKDYGHMLAGDADYAREGRNAFRTCARDISEYLADLELPEPAANIAVPGSARRLPFGLLHAAWPADPLFSRRLLLERAGFDVCDVPEGHLCCGSAGTYNILQPEIAERLRDRGRCATSSGPNS